MSMRTIVMQQRHGLTVGLGLVAVLLLGVIGYETGWGTSVRRLPAGATAGGRGVDVAAVPPPYVLPPLDAAYRESGERPLFSPSRRPPATSAQATMPAMVKGQFRLSGTTVNDQLAVAFLFETATGRTLRITKGSVIHDKTLSVVEPTRVVLKQGEESEELTLRTAPSPARPAATVVPAPAPGQPQSNQPNPPASVVPPSAPVPRPATLMPQPAQGGQAAIQPAPGNSVLPGFVNPAATAPQPATQPAAPTEVPPAQRRRRFNPPTPQQ